MSFCSHSSVVYHVPKEVVPPLGCALDYSLALVLFTLCKKESQVKSEKMAFSQEKSTKSQYFLTFPWLFVDFSWLKAIFFDFTWLSFLQRLSLMVEHVKHVNPGFNGIGKHCCFFFWQGPHPCWDDVSASMDGSMTYRVMTIMRLWSGRFFFSSYLPLPCHPSSLISCTITYLVVLLFFFCLLPCTVTTASTAQPRLWLIVTLVAALRHHSTTFQDILYDSFAYTDTLNLLQAV